MSSLEKLDGDFAADSVEIRDVWDSNLEDEFSLIRSIADDYPFVAMDIEFPGVALRPVGPFQSAADFNYRTLKSNADHLKLIQVGLVFSDSSGPSLLRHSGIDFEKNRHLGGAAPRFAELIMSSGVVANHSVHWITFHGGDDFGYLLKILTCRDLPDNREGFFSYLRLYFPNVYDIKHLMRFCNNLYVIYAKSNVFRVYCHSNLFSAGRVQH